VWKAAVDGQVLHFELAGINNQNFIMRDAETGSWWQQVTGEAIQGPLKGRRLELVPWDEVSFALWRRERPDSRVLRADARYAEHYAAADWDQDMDRYPTVVPPPPGDPLPPRELVVGVEIGGEAKAYPFAVLAERSPVVDEIGGVPLLVVVGEDGKSVRCFDRRVDGEALDFYRLPGLAPLRLVDARTASEWDFAGRALAGPLAGRELARVRTLKDYWFDWRLYHPQTRLYAAGLSSPGD
jgi:hypothetical protein